MELNKEIIKSRIDIIERNLKEIKEISNQKFFTYRDELALKHALLECIEACVDIANHIISVKGFRKAESYSDVFKVLEENGIINKDLSEKLQSMVKFRNVLVHRYANVDFNKIVEFSKKDIKDIEEFIKIVLNFVK